MAAWTLRRYQTEALRGIAASWLVRRATVVIMATGTGKTTLFAEVLARRAAAKRGRGLVIAHRKELIQQAAQRIALAGLSVEIESGESKASVRSMFPSDVVVATVQTMQGRRLEQWPSDAFATVIVDECHHITAAGYRAVIDRFPGAKVLGVTATADRGDKVAIGHVIDDCAYEYHLRAAIEDGFLVPLLLVGVDTPCVDLSTVRTTQQEHGKDFSAEDLSRVMRSEPQLLHALSGSIVREAGPRPTLVFVPSVEVAHELVRALAAYPQEQGHGRRAEALDGGSSAQLRAEALARYQRGETQMLVNCALFTEGFDAPKTAMVAIARPTKSRQLYAQMVGRGTRLSDSTAAACRDPLLEAAQRSAIILGSDKPNCKIVDLAPENMRHSLVAAVDLLDGLPLPDDLAKEARRAEGGDILAALKKAEETALVREAKRKNDRSGVVADVKYRRIERDPFEELGIEGSVTGKGHKASEGQLEAIARSGIVLSKTPSAKEASRILSELSRRRQAGLPSIKMERKLSQHGLKAPTFEEARAALDALAASGWKVTPEIDVKWGTSDPADDYDRSV